MAFRELGNNYTSTLFIQSNPKFLKGIFTRITLPEINYIKHIEPFGTVFYNTCRILRKEAYKVEIKIARLNAFGLFSVGLSLQNKSNMNCLRFTSSLCGTKRLRSLIDEFVFGMSCRCAFIFKWLILYKMVILLKLFSFDYYRNSDHLIIYLNCIFPRN